MPRSTENRGATADFGAFFVAFASAVKGLRAFSADNHACKQAWFLACGAAHRQGCTGKRTAKGHCLRLQSAGGQEKQRGGLALRNNRALRRKLPVSQSCRKGKRHRSRALPAPAKRGWARKTAERVGLTQQQGLAPQTASEPIIPQREHASPHATAPRWSAWACLPGDLRQEKSPVSQCAYGPKHTNRSRPPP